MKINSRTYRLSLGSTDVVLHIVAFLSVAVAYPSVGAHCVAGSTAVAGIATLSRAGAAAGRLLIGRAVTVFHDGKWQQATVVESSPVGPLVRVNFEPTEAAASGPLWVDHTDSAVLRTVEGVLSPDEPQLCAAKSAVERGTVSLKFDFGQRLQCLRKVPQLKGLSEQSYNVLAKAFIRKEFEAGDDIIVQGEAGDTMYFVQSGCPVAIVDGLGKVADLAPGSFFGELACVSEAPRTATVRAQNDPDTGASCVVWELSRIDVQSQFGRDRQLAVIDTSITMYEQDRLASLVKRIQADTQPQANLETTHGSDLEVQLESMMRDGTISAQDIDKIRSSLKFETSTLKSMRIAAAADAEAERRRKLEERRKAFGNFVGDVDGAQCEQGDIDSAQRDQFVSHSPKQTELQRRLVAQKGRNKRIDWTVVKPSRAATHRFVWMHRFASARNVNCEFQVDSTTPKLRSARLSQSASSAQNQLRCDREIDTVAARPIAGIGLMARPRTAPSTASVGPQSWQAKPPSARRAASARSRSMKSGLHGAKVDVANTDAVETQQAAGAFSQCSPRSFFGGRVAGGDWGAGSRPISGQKRAQHAEIRSVLSSTGYANPPSRFTNPEGSVYFARHGLRSRRWVTGASAREQCDSGRRHRHSAATVSGLCMAPRETMRRQNVYDAATHSRQRARRLVLRSPRHLVTQVPTVST